MRQESHAAGGHRLRRLYRGEEGNATIEFVILFPIFMVLFLSAFEIGLLMVRQVMLDRATDIAVRSLRIGEWNNPTHDDLKDFICEQALILPDCKENMLIELSPVSKSTWQPLPEGPTCVDKSTEIQPVVNFEVGIQHELMMVRVCALQKPLAPLTGLGLKLPRHDADHYALVSLSAFVNEPS
ncbi:TadE/TadG family type IV pilus assembly protein [Tropicimonas sp. IMCC6043]|uniref:TadE/TadG family type IV pilus assembly protein n=1 Tax=Tropicimonas sp. IMCC6043 TaxID=2510645 RepID=UPI00101D5BDF|nr:TadE/TadG family type IV pilus assembly protein [Tropicimonas sp. IMCC6043]RYH08408.1 pilus assembly protein [Tropicimonas sp. IMCC6043]